MSTCSGHCYCEQFRAFVRQSKALPSSNSLVQLFSHWQARCRPSGRYALAPTAGSGRFASQAAGRFCTASKALLDAVDSGHFPIDGAYIVSMIDMLMELGATAGSVDDEARPALFSALHNTISAALRWPVPSSAVELRVEELVKKLCAAATGCAKDILGFDDSGAILRSPRSRDDAVRLASALLTGNALHSFAQRMSGASQAAQGALLRHQRKQQQQQQHEGRPMGQGVQQQQQRQQVESGAAAGGRLVRQRQLDAAAASSSSSSSGIGCIGDCGSEASSSLLLELLRIRVAEWLPTLEQLGTLIHTIARHDPYAPISAHQSSISILGLGAPPPVPLLERGRPPPVRRVRASALRPPAAFWSTLRGPW